MNLAEVHDLSMRNMVELEARLARAKGDILGELVTEWLEWLKSPGVLAPRTRRPYAPKTIERYEYNWNAFFAALPAGRGASVHDITKGFIAAFRKERIKDKLTGATVNRDLIALKSFWRWLEDEKQITGVRLPIKMERETDGCERWLTADEIRALKGDATPQWWALFATMVYTGARVSEAQGLRWADINYSSAYISIHGRHKRLKTSSSSRMVPLNAEVVAALAVLHQERQPGPNDLVFVGDLGDKQRAYRAFVGLMSSLRLQHARLHDLRHTFGVHAAQAGIPVTRLQQLMGHSSPVTTLRYMRHAPGNYLIEDGDRIAASMRGDSRPRLFVTRNETIVRETA